LICSVAACCFASRITTPSRTATMACRLVVAGIGALLGRAGAGPDVLSLMAETAGALPDI